MDPTASATSVCVRMRPPNQRESGTRCLARAAPTVAVFTPPPAAGSIVGEAAAAGGAAAAAASEFRFTKVYGARSALLWRHPSTA